MKILIHQSTDPQSWYSNRIGHVLDVEKMELNENEGQGIPEDVYWCREGGIYNPLNYVRKSDAREY